MPERPEIPEAAWPDKLYARLPDPLPEGWNSKPFLSINPGFAANEEDKAERIYIAVADLRKRLLTDEALWAAACAEYGADRKGWASEERMRATIAAALDSIGVKEEE